MSDFPFVLVSGSSVRFTAILLGAFTLKLASCEGPLLASFTESAIPRFPLHQVAMLLYGQPTLATIKTKMKANLRYGISLLA